MEKTHKNVLDSGYTTYHDDGSKSVTYKNVTDTGYTTYHSDGSKTVSYQHFTNDGYSSVHIPADHSFDFIYGIFAFSVVFLSIVSLFSLGKHAIIALALLALSVVARVLIVRKNEKTIAGLLWFYPFTLLGWRLLVNAMWEHTNGNFLEPFGIFFISLGIIATLFLDSRSFVSFSYGFLTFIIMVIAKAYGEYVPYWLVLVMLVIALIWTLAKGAKRLYNGCSKNT